MPRDADGPSAPAAPAAPSRRLGHGALPQTRLVPAYPLQDTAAEMAKGYMDEETRWMLFDMLGHRNEWCAGRARWRHDQRGWLEWPASVAGCVSRRLGRATGAGGAAAP